MNKITFKETTILNGHIPFRSQQNKKKRTCDKFYISSFNVKQYPMLNNGTKRMAETLKRDEENLTDIQSV